MSLAGRMYAASHLTGTFTLRSGRVATEYFDKYRFESDPALLSEIAELAAGQIPEGTQGLAGLELGGVPFATVLSLKTGLPLFLVRKEAKKYGTERICEGGDVSGLNLLVVEDVVTTGGQIVLSTDDLRAAGAVITNALCVIDRESGGPDLVAQSDVTLRSLFTMTELQQAGAASD
ncbi:MAG TPA: orotate phosphoribosyltransferase [Acidimicrobiales bacterium]